MNVMDIWNVLNVCFHLAKYANEMILGVLLLKDSTFWCNCIAALSFFLLCYCSPFYSMVVYVHLIQGLLSLMASTYQSNTLSVRLGTVPKFHFNLDIVLFLFCCCFCPLSVFVVFLSFTFEFPINTMAFYGLQRKRERIERILSLSSQSHLIYYYVNYFVFILYTSSPRLDSLV